MKVVRLALEVMAKLSLLDEQFFNKLMLSLLDLFSKDRSLLENRATLSITQLSLFIDPHKIYISLSLILQARQVNLFFFLFFFVICEFYLLIRISNFVLL
jgi:hypothetical protein